jgi:hypothetical protein
MVGRAETAPWRADNRRRELNIFGTREEGDVERVVTQETSHTQGLGMYQETLKMGPGDLIVIYCLPLRRIQPR